MKRYLNFKYSPKKEFRYLVQSVNSSNCTEYNVCILYLIQEFSFLYSHIGSKDKFLYWNDFECIDIDFPLSFY